MSNRPDKPDPGARDRLVLCGLAAIKALGLTEANNAPGDVRDAIRGLRASLATERARHKSNLKSVMQAVEGMMAGEEDPWPSTFAGIVGDRVPQHTCMVTATAADGSVPPPCPACMRQALVTGEGVLTGARERDAGCG